MGAVPTLGGLLRMPVPANQLNATASPAARELLRRRVHHRFLGRNGSVDAVEATHSSRQTGHPGVSLHITGGAHGIHLQLQVSNTLTRPAGSSTRTTTAALRPSVAAGSAAPPQPMAATMAAAAPPRASRLAPPGRCCSISKARLLKGSALHPTVPATPPCCLAEHRGNYRNIASSVEFFVPRRVCEPSESRAGAGVEAAPETHAQPGSAAHAGAWTHRQQCISQHDIVMLNALH